MPRPIGFVRQVAEQVISIGGATSDDLADIFPSKTKAQIIKALRNAKDAGLIHLIKPGQSLGRSKGRAPGQAAGHCSAGGVLRKAKGPGGGAENLRQPVYLRPG